MNCVVRVLINIPIRGYCFARFILKLISSLCYIYTLKIITYHMNRYQHSTKHILVFIQCYLVKKKSTTTIFYSTVLIVHKRQHSAQRSSSCLHVLHALSNIVQHCPTVILSRLLITLKIITYHMK